MKWLIAGAFGLLQFVLSKKSRSRILRYGLMCVLVVGLLACALIYFGLTAGVSQSVVAENRAFAHFMAELLTAGAIGCGIGHVLGKPRQ